MTDHTLSWVFMAMLASPLAVGSEQRFKALPAIYPEPATTPLPSLSIVVPARNEAGNLPRLLSSLKSIDYPGSWELIVVNDNSTDDTANVARQYGAKVVCLNSLPPGWLGKPYACHRGALASSGEWLLFTDADTIHKSWGPASVVAYARRYFLDGLSIFPRQITSGLFDRLGLFVAFAGLFSGLMFLRPGGSNDVTPGPRNSAKSRRTIINGQYILIRREVYERSGGFAAVASEPLEDLALGRLLRTSGYRVAIARGEQIANVQMYSDKTTLWHGLSRLGAGSLRWLGVGSILTIFFITGAMAPILALISALKWRRNRKWALTSWVFVALGFVPWARRFGSAWLAIFVPLGALLVQAAAIWGLIGRLFGRGTSWKGRSV